MGRDFIAYRNHVYRVVNLCLAIAGGGDRAAAPGVLEKIAVAAVFHDLGIWTNHTSDYIAPSAALAPRARVGLRASRLGSRDRGDDRDHHKITSAHLDRASLVEPFRRADWSIR